MKHTLMIAMSFFYIEGLFSQQADALSERDSGTTKISGAVDVYYRYDFNHSVKYPYNSVTSFTHSSNSFELGMASLRVDHQAGKIHAAIDLGWGKRAEEFAYHDEGPFLAIKQVYVEYAPLEKLKFTVGSWATHLGYEMVDAWLNRNYSSSYMFTNGPFSHTGIKADFHFRGKSAIMMGLANPTDYRTAPAMPKTFIGQFSTASADDQLKFYFNFTLGKQSPYKKVQQGDVVASYVWSEKLNIGVNATLQSVRLDADSSGKFARKSWGGIAVYLNADPLKWLGVTLRTEYIRDRDEFLGMRKVFAPTLSANIRADRLTIIPEFRMDKAGNSIFYKKNNNNKTGTTTSSFLLAVTYHF